MTAQRIHRAVSADGTPIAGRVRGAGPALVLVHGGIGDGDIAWEALLPHLADRFTCYTPSTRGRGLSANHPDHSPPRLEEDVVAFADSIGEPVRLLGWSGSGAWVLGAAARSSAVAAAAVFEPGVLSVMREDDLARTAATFERVGTAAAEGRLVEACHEVADWLCTDAEIAALARTGFLERWAAAVPALLRFVAHDASYDGPRSTDPEALGQVVVPVLLLRGAQTKLGRSFADAAQHCAEHVADGHVRELAGAGHFAPLLAAESLAEELVAFFEAAGHPAVARVAHR